jgi:catechol 2,3-dioxygenase-like lactoylglutathione lyase family enzyme
MGVNACQHVALRVTDMERSIAFYTDAFAAHHLTLPFTVEGPEIEEMFGGHAGLRMTVCILGFDEGVIELFQFLEPVHPATAIDPPRSNLIHWALQVDSVEDALARVEAAGGKAVRPILDWAGANVVFCTDPDGNVFELLDTSMAQTAERTFTLFPEARP